MNKTGRQWYIEVPWGRMSVLAWGDCLAPPVLLVHGRGDCSASFLPIVPFLPQHFYYVAIDLPGLGKSDRFPQGMMITMHDLLCTISIVVKHFNWQNFMYVGHGLGAILGKLYNYHVPNKITQLVEIEPVDFVAIPPESFGEWYRKYFSTYFKYYSHYNEPVEMTPKVTLPELVEQFKRERRMSHKMATVMAQWCLTPASDMYVRYSPDRRYCLIPPLPYAPEFIRAVFLNMDIPMLTVLSTEWMKRDNFTNTLFLQDEANYPYKNFRCIKIEGTRNIHMLYPERVAPFVGQFLLDGLATVGMKSKL